MSDKIVPMTVSTRAGRNALDEFLPEIAVERDQTRRRHPHVDGGDIDLDTVEPSGDTIEVFAQPELRTVPTVDSSANVQFWPMIAAACVVLGISLLALALFARFELPL